MPLVDAELNRLANDISASALTAYAHTGAPGNNGTANRVAGVSAALAAANWSAAAGGDVAYNQAISFGVLHASNAITVTHISLFRGNAYVGFVALASSTAVAAGSSFSVNSGTLQVNLSST